MVTDGWALNILVSSVEPDRIGVVTKIHRSVVESTVIVGFCCPMVILLLGSFVRGLVAGGGVVHILENLVYKVIEGS